MAAQGRLALLLLALGALAAGPAQALDNGVRTPALGWSTWNAFNKNVSDAKVRESASVLVSSGLAKLGFVYVNIDGEHIPGGRPLPSSSARAI